MIIAEFAIGGKDKAGQAPGTGAVRSSTIAGPKACWSDRLMAKTSLWITL